MGFGKFSFMSFQFLYKEKQGKVEPFQRKSRGAFRILGLMGMVVAYARRLYQFVAQEVELEVKGII
eukprot:c5647_g1_i1 orf=63-260(+)